MSSLPSSEIQSVGQYDEVADRHVPRPGEHEQHCVSNFLRLHQAARRQRFVELRLRPVLEQRRYDGAGGDLTDSDPVLENLPSQRVDEGLDGVLRGRVDGLPYDRDEARHGTRSMMSPDCRSTMCGSTAWIHRKTALTLRFSMRSQASGSPPSTSPPTYEPALAWKMSS